MPKTLSYVSPLGVPVSGFVPLADVGLASDACWRRFPGHPLLGLEPSQMNEALLRAGHAPLRMRQLAQAMEHLGSQMPDLFVILDSRSRAAAYTRPQREGSERLSLYAGFEVNESVELVNSSYHRASLLKRLRERETIAFPQLAPEPAAVRDPILPRAA